MNGLHLAAILLTQLKPLLSDRRPGYYNVMSHNECSYVNSYACDESSFGSGLMYVAQAFTGRSCGSVTASASQHRLNAMWLMDRNDASYEHRYAADGS